jgi:small subunit ribosomal protein S6
MTIRVDAHETGPSAMMRKSDRERGDRDSRGPRGDRDRGERTEFRAAREEEVE